MSVETLSAKRCRFSLLFCHLQDHARALGFTVAIDQVKRLQIEAENNAKSGAGILHSLHLLGLAGDLLLYKDGVYLSSTEEYRSLGEFWEALAPDARWGGRFRPKPDGDHFSLEHEGIK